MRRGLTLGGLMVVLAVVLLFLAITLPIYYRARTGRLEKIDTDRMRELYVALSLYQAGNENVPSPTLLGARPYLGDTLPFLSDSDPWAEQPSGPFPIDPELPQTNVTAPYRISYSYLLDFVGPGKNRADSWRKDLFDPRVGLLTCHWHGTITPTGAPFAAKIVGPVLRVNTDGSLFRLGDGGDGQMGDWNTLFYKR